MLFLRVVGTERHAVPRGRQKVSISPGPKQLKPRARPADGCRALSWLRRGWCFAVCLVCALCLLSHARVSHHHQSAQARPFPLLSPSSARGRPAEFSGGSARLQFRLAAAYYFLLSSTLSLPAACKNAQGKAAVAQAWPVPVVFGHRRCLRRALDACAPSFSTSFCPNPS